MRVFVFVFQGDTDALLVMTDCLMSLLLLLLLLLLLPWCVILLYNIYCYSKPTLG